MNALVKHCALAFPTMGGGSVIPTAGTGDAFCWGDFTDSSTLCLTEVRGKRVQGLHAGSGNVVLITDNWEVIWVGQSK